MCELAEWFKNRLKEKYEEHVFFAEIKGRANVVFKRVSQLFSE